MSTPEPPPPAQPEIEPITAWHPMLVALLEAYLPHGYELVSELLLTRLPQRIDIVVIRKTGEPAGKARKIHAILDYLALHTLIEHKGPTDTLAGEDALVLLGYAFQYMRLKKVKDPGDVLLMVVADRISGVFARQIERHGGAFERTRPGVWQGRLAGFPLHGVETGEASAAGPTERLLYAFSRAFLERPTAMAPLDGEDRSVYLSLYQQVEQFRRLRGDLAMKDMEQLRKAAETFEQELLRRKSPEELARLLSGLPPELRVAGLAPEERVAGLAPEDRLAGLTEEQIAELFARHQKNAPGGVKKKPSA